MMGKERALVRSEEEPDGKDFLRRSMGKKKRKWEVPRSLQNKKKEPSKSSPEER